MDEFRRILPQPIEAAKPLVVLSPDFLHDSTQNIPRLSDSQLADLSRAIFTDFSFDEYAFHQKVLMDAKLFLEKKLKHKNFNFKMNL